MNDFKYIEYSQKFHSKLKRLCAPLFQSFGINHFFYQRLDSEGHLSGMGTDVDWLSCYFESGFHLDNPLFNQYSALRSGCFLPQTFKHKTLQRGLEFFQNRFQIVFATLILKKKEDGIHQYGFYCPTTNFGVVTSLFINEYSVLEKFIHYFEENSLKIRQELYVDPEDIQSFNYKKSNFALPSAIFAMEEKLAFLKKIHFFDEAIPQFSKREKECIELCLQGHTMREISEKLNLSPRTIEGYLNNLKTKLNCYTKSELIHKLQKIKAVFP